MATNAAARAEIRRATRRAQAALGELDDRGEAEIEAIYQQAQAALQADIASYAGADGNLRVEALRSLEAQIEQILAAAAARRDAILTAGITQAASLGATPWAGASVAVSLPAISQEAAQIVTTFAADDGLTLSDRLWRIDLNARQAMARSVQTAVVRGQSISAAVNDFLARGAAVPADLAAQQGLASVANVQRVAADALMTGSMNPRDQSLRVFRTEINRAHGLAYQAGAFAQPDVIGTRFLLSPRHPEVDECDMHARVNRYGLGPGVYPKGRSPWPAHPNTLSFEEAVFEDEVSDEDRAGQQTRIEWLKAQPARTRTGVLGGQRKAWAFEQGHVSERSITTPWRVLEKRLRRQGVDLSPVQ